MTRKKSEEISIPADRPKSARRESRARVGPVPPVKLIPAAKRKPPKHKKRALDDATE